MKNETTFDLTQFHEAQKTIEHVQEQFSEKVREAFKNNNVISCHYVEGHGFFSRMIVDGLSVEFYVEVNLKYMNSIGRFKNIITSVTFSCCPLSIYSKPITLDVEKLKLYCLGQSPNFYALNGRRLTVTNSQRIQ